MPGAKLNRKTVLANEMDRTANSEPQQGQLISPRRYIRNKNVTLAVVRNACIASLRYSRARCSRAHERA